MDGETPVAPRDQMRHCQFVHFLTPTTCSFLSRPAQCSSLALYNAHHKWMRTLCRCIWDLGREGESRKDSFKFYTRSHELHNNNEINSNMKHYIYIYIEMIGNTQHTNEHIYCLFHCLFLNLIMKVSYEFEWYLLPVIQYPDPVGISRVVGMEWKYHVTVLLSRNVSASSHTINFGHTHTSGSGLFHKSLKESLYRF